MGTSKNLVRTINEKNVLQQIFNYGPISRSQVSKNLSLNKVTVSDIFSGLIERNYLQELGAGNSTKNGGRKPTMLQFNGHFGYTVNFDFGYDYIDRMVNLLDGAIVQYDRFSCSKTDVQARLDLMEEKVNEIKLNDTQSGLLGISIAIHGIVYHNRVLYTPFVDIGSVDLAKYFYDRFQVHILLENEANLSAVYERDFASQNSNENIVALSIHKGIGAGIIIGNQVYRGIKGEAGEIGHMVIYEKNQADHKSVQTIEQYCSEDAILDRARQRKGNQFIERKDLKNLYNAGDKDIVTILNEFAFYSANVIYNVIVSFDPGRIVINSNLLADIPELLRKIQRNITYLTAEHTPISLINDVRNATLLGGCSLITHQILEMDGRQLLFRN